MIGEVLNFRHKVISLLIVAENCLRIHVFKGVFLYMFIAENTLLFHHLSLNYLTKDKRTIYLFRCVLCGLCVFIIISNFLIFFSIEHSCVRVNQATIGQV